MTHNPSIIVALAPSGELYAERFANGQRQKIDLIPGLELTQLRAILLEQREVLKRREAREAERIAEERKARHRRVFVATAQQHGLGFARRVIGGKEPDFSRMGQNTRERSAPVDILDSM